MGGLGSGRYAYATTPTVESCRQLDANAFTEVVKHPGSRVTITWGDSEDPSASISVYVEGDPTTDDRAPSLRLSFATIDTGTDEQLESIDYRVPIEYTECLGGVRPWFSCPGVVDGEACNRRVRKMYCPPRSDLYLCRHCFDLGYTSSRTSGNALKQAELRYQRAFAKADVDGRRPHPIGEHILPERAPGMAADRYKSLLADVRVAHLEWESASQAEQRTILNHASSLRR